MKNKNRNYILGALAIVVLLFNIFLVIFNKSYNNVFWLAYSFIMFSFLLIGINIVFNTRKIKDANILGIPLLYLTLLYFVLNFVLNFIFILFTNLNMKYVAISDFTLLSIYAVIVLLSLAGEKYIKDSTNKVKEKTNFIKKLNATLLNIAISTVDEILKEKIKNVAEIVEYSDPISSDELKELEGEISKNVLKLEQNIASNNYDEVPKNINLIEKLIKERNFKIKTLK